ncbi:MAG TPA: MFS transporter [Myxococcaceae bacterium]|nr:MFS transporter [Myxococcaceae bacterium]
MTESAVPWWKEPTRGQWMSFLAAWIGWVMDAFDFTIYILVVPDIVKDVGVTQTSAMWILTLTLTCRLLGGMVAGAAADKWGRKLPLMLSLLWFAIFDGSIFFAHSYLTILVLRTLFGFGMGAEWTAGATLAMENWPQRSRGIASGILQGSWAIGFFLAALASEFVVPALGWRWLFLIAVAPALLALPIRIWVPESPEFLARKGGPVKREPLWDLSAFRGQWTGLALSVLLMALGFAVYYGLVGPYPSMLEKVHGLDTIRRARLVQLFNVGMLGGAAVFGWLAGRRGARVAIGLPAAAMVLCLPLYVGLGVKPDLLWVGAILGGVFGAGFCGVTPLLLTNFFPAAVRARSVGFAYHAGAFVGAFVPTAITALSEHAGLTLAWSLALLTGASLVLLVAALFIPFKQLEAPPRAAVSPDSAAVTA